jgi:UDP-N-acetylglucosamine--N-acetylmuramyl-(pentapeptide) pyrophosphoryl-undecaprenol N-acetylglucosamine transferase
LLYRRGHDSVGGQKKQVAQEIFQKIESMSGESNEKRILFAGGGTAGHLMPAINIAREMVNLNKFIIPSFVGKKDGMERGIVAKYGFEINEIDVIGMKRTITGIIRFGIKWFGGYNQARGIINEIAPVAVVGTGGYISAPVVKAAYKKKIPIFLQEQNSLPGLASRTLSKYADLIFTAYESAAGYLGRDKCRLVGNPIRADITSAEKGDSIRLFDLDAHKSTLLILGGSSGARGINSVILDLVNYDRVPEGWQILWQTGKKDIKFVNSSIKNDAGNVRVLEFIDDMPAAYAAADLVISRAGAMAISEITAAGLPSVLIPYPHATGDHQMLNAKSLEESGATVIIREDELPDKFGNIIIELFANKEMRRSMSEKALGFGRPEAARVIAKEILGRVNEI